MKLLFVINNHSGHGATNWDMAITDYLKSATHDAELYRLPANIDLEALRQKIAGFSPQRVIAVGGDGTVKLVVTCLMGKGIPLGILPAGSANGMAKELGISTDPLEALGTIDSGVVKKIHVTKVNEEYCIHLSDIGLNALAIKKFEKLKGRGMWGYLKASLLVLRKNPLMTVEIEFNQKILHRKAVIIVIANATRYGTGAVINPIGKLDDEQFEVIVVKKISIGEIIKMVFSHAPYNHHKTEVFQARTLSIKSVKKVHFQVDGEYLGMINEVTATLIPQAIEIIVPAE